MTQQKRHPAGSQCCSLIGGRLTAMSQDWQGKYGTVTQSHSAFLYSPSNHSRGLYTQTIHPLYSPAFFPVHLWAVFPVLIRVMMMVKDALSPVQERRCGRRNRCEGKIVAKQREALEWGRTASSHTDGGSSRRHEAWTERKMTMIDIHVWHFILYCFIWNWITFNLKE